MSEWIEVKNGRDYGTIYFFTAYSKCPDLLLLLLKGFRERLPKSSISWIRGDTLFQLSCTCLFTLFTKR